MNLVKKVSDGLFRIEKFIVSILVAVMCVVLFVSVAMRYVFGAPLYWSGELAIFALVWVSFLGGSMAIKLEQAVAVTIVTDRLPERIQKIVYTIGWAIIIVFCIFLFIYSLKWINLPSMMRTRTDALQIQVFYPYLIIPIGFFCLSVHSICKFLENLQSLLGRESK